MLTKKYEIDLALCRDYLTTPETKTYKELIKELKTHYTVMYLLELLNISKSTHIRWLKTDCENPPIKIYLSLLNSVNKEIKK